MKRSLPLLILGILAVMTTGCEQSQESQGPWIPVLEDTGFSYLRDSVAGALTAVSDASDKLKAGQDVESGEALEGAINQLLRLHLYYLPMTEVRQLLYDADRLFHIKQVDQAEEKLSAANRILIDVARSGGPNLEGSVNELILMIDELILSIRERSTAATEKFREVGHRANLMATKGELILSDVEFHPNPGPLGPNSLR